MSERGKSSVVAAALACGAAIGALAGAALAGDTPAVVASEGASAPPPILGLRTPPEGFVDLETIPGARLAIRYHTRHNFTEAPLPGYGAPGAWLIADAAASLGRVGAALVEQGYGLLIFDAYRPARGTLAMVAWAERAGRTDLLTDGYVARRSGHNRGDTVDLSLYDLATSAELDMGTPWDTFDAAAHTANAAGDAAVNRAILIAAMEAEGWWNYPKEWWHFTLVQDPVPAYRDVPYGCFEPDEGQWSPPEGWSAAGWAPPMDWPTDVDCG